MNKKMLKQVFLIFCLTVMAMVYTGCGNNGTNTTNGNGTQNGAQSEGSTVLPENGAGTNNGSSADTSTGNNNGTSNVGQDIGNAASDVANGVGDMVDDLSGVDYSDYDSAHEYLLGQIGGTDSTNRYEVRNENRELQSYNSSDSNSKGYRYEVYDTSKGNGEKYGVFYVDQKTGKIYKENGTNNVEEYKTK